MSDKERPDEYDNCVACGKKTPYKKTDHIDMRMHYIEGAGQLCEECGKKHCA